MASEWVYDLRGKEIVFTGKIEDFIKDELAKIARSLGAGNVGGWINQSTTDVLVRGWSPNWKYGDFGEKEKQVADLQAVDHHIQLNDAGASSAFAQASLPRHLRPHMPNARARADVAEGGLAGTPYRAGTFAGPLQGDGEHHRDPDIMERGLKAHLHTQDKLADLLGLHGLTPLSPFDKRCNFDLGFR